MICSTTKTFIDDFVRRNPEWTHDPALALGKCTILSHRLVEELAGSGVKAFVVSLHDPIDVDYVGDHQIVQIEDDFVDMTRRQFDALAEVPTYYEPLSSAGRHWRYWRRWDDDIEVHHVLHTETP